MKSTLLTTLEYSKNLIISPDIDGFMSAYLLYRQFGSQIVGTYDKNILCLAKDIDPSQCLFVDCDMNTQSFISVGNHMRLPNDNMAQLSFNPNRHYETYTYTQKFPYATCFLIAAVIETPITDQDFYRMGYADSTYSNMRNYSNNMREWSDRVNHPVFSRIIKPSIQDILGIEFLRREYKEQQSYTSKRYGKARYIETLNFALQNSQIAYKPLSDGIKYMADKVGINTVMRYNKDIISYAEIYTGEYSITYNQEIEWK